MEWKEGSASALGLRDNQRSENLSQTRFRDKANRNTMFPEALIIKDTGLCWKGFGKLKEDNTRKPWA